VYGETIVSGTGFVGFSTRGIDGTIEAAHNDGSTVRILSNVGVAGTIRTGATATGTILGITTLGSIDVNDYIRTLRVWCWNYWRTHQSNWLSTQQNVFRLLLVLVVTPPLRPLN